MKCESFWLSMLFRHQMGWAAVLLRSSIIYPKPLSALDWVARLWGVLIITLAAGMLEGGWSRIYHHESDLWQAHNAAVCGNGAPYCTVHIQYYSYLTPLYNTASAWDVVIYLRTRKPTEETPCAYFWCYRGLPESHQHSASLGSDAVEKVPQAEARRQVANGGAVNWC